MIGTVTLALIGLWAFSAMGIHRVVAIGSPADRVIVRLQDGRLYVIHFTSGASPFDASIDVPGWRKWLSEMDPLTYRFFYGSRSDLVVRVEDRGAFRFPNVWKREVGYGIRLSPFVGVAMVMSLLALLVLGLQKSIPRRGATAGQRRNPQTAERPSASRRGEVCDSVERLRVQGWLSMTASHRLLFWRVGSLFALLLTVAMLGIACVALPRFTYTPYSNMPDRFWMWEFPRSYYCIDLHSGFVMVTRGQPVAGPSGLARYHSHSSGSEFWQEPYRDVLNLVRIERTFTKDYSDQSWKEEGSLVLNVFRIAIALAVLFFAALFLPPFRAGILWWFHRPIRMARRVRHPALGID
ncbi:MAG: hypothetical protein ACTHM6_06010 [Tepidisphaeraceae bacterium]